MSSDRPCRQRLNCVLSASATLPTQLQPSNIQHQPPRTMIGSAGANVKPELATNHAVMQDVKPDLKLDLKNEVGAPEGGYPHLQLFNVAQVGAVTCDNPAVIILAGPGGRARHANTSRVADLVLRRDVRPENIVVVTFTNKATNEMRERIQKAIGPYMTGRLQMGTFHALCAKLLCKHGYRIELKSNFTIADRSDSEAYMKRIVKAVDPKCAKPANYLRYQDELKAHNILDFDDLLVYVH
ncbi:hypothetical protein AMAG_20322 [Allomyces macrogynus ATCC 38327]|uniref:UvrD-like helicase ATP-binding domain-containing protein n=1 Tax=Allomyces macrogynus (strain ATCC 38327) TaxID=578462 RepID=A0A0L0T8Y0_ALLM3|nr:hypothetical protein AMAG_20322 [Allomyces macrogynus ATCC 38327]|eukprot:KNE71273.1 hypothetical protein AMAG_20322 [Allomyces macrogynus ATCC 38327]